MSQERKEFPIRVEKEAYVIPTVGIFSISAIAVAVVVCFFMIFIGSLLHIPDVFGMVSIFVGGVAGVFLWISHLRRVHTGRRIVLDEEGITYFHFANDKRFVAWNSIDEFKVMDGYDSDNPTYSEVFVGKKKVFRFQASDFDFVGMNEFVKIRIPGKFKVVPYK
ncbi:MAG TPA: hypothetical protein EYN91_09880 [Candidatus Melainabacteria bacterium]|nr:hypothetical protein [Candidatus Melainabacteria bacterium]HIN66234.1 hypothetical protein [Candidatus Obscuribacterales bacterium]